MVDCSIRDGGGPWWNGGGGPAKWGPPLPAGNGGVPDAPGNGAGGPPAIPGGGGPNGGRPPVLLNGEKALA